MGKLKEIIKKVVSIGVIEAEGDKKKQKPSKITNKLLLQELVTHFEQVMDDKSVGRRILYPIPTTTTKQKSRCLLCYRKLCRRFMLR